MEEQGLPGLKARYEFAAADNSVELRLRLHFDPVEAGSSEAAREAWLEHRHRLAGGTGTKLPPAEAALVISLAAAPLTVESDALSRLTCFVADVASGPALASEPVEADLAFRLPEAEVAALPSDIIRIDVRIQVGSTTIAVAVPDLENDPGGFAFATAFEEAWSGFDGADGCLTLAREDGSEPAALWCVRTGRARGIAIARPASAEVDYFAVPPLSTRPLSGTVEGVGGIETVQSVDLDLWWDDFAREFARLESAAGSGALGDRMARVRPALARALASRLLPVASKAIDHGVAELRCVYEAVAQADLGRRPVVAAEAVEISRSAGAADTAAVLHDRPSPRTGTAAATEASPAAVPLGAGRQRLAYAVERSMRFEGNRIERPGLPALDLILHARSRTSALGLDLGLDPPPGALPLIALPGAPDLSVAGAATCREAAALGTALAWSVDVESRIPPVPQDRLELALDFEPCSDTSAAPSPPLDGLLFETLGRAVLYAVSMPANPEPAQIERFAELAEAVAQALPGWPPRIAETRPLPGKWRYGVDFRDLPALIVGREAPCGKPLPPWPEIAGFLAPASDGSIARYEPDGEAAPGLHVTLPGLRLLADRAVRVHGRICRNASVTEAVEPAFVYHGAVVTLASHAPLLEWRAPRPEPGAASLEAALDGLLSAIDEDCGEPYALGLEAVLVRRLGQAEAPFETRIPLGLLPRVEIGGEKGSSVAGLAGEIAAALSAARATLEPDGTAVEVEVELAITLFEREPARMPLARIDVRIPVPEGEAWWETASP